MKRLLSILFFICITTSVFAQADKILGTWLSADKKAHVEIYKTASGTYYGKIIWLAEPNDPATGKPKVDSKNPDASKRNSPLLGSLTFLNFTYDNGDYTGGKIYDCRDGKTYTGKLWLNDDGTLSMRGYIGFLYSTETWTRLK
ncbi:DUF2147 domain-containing protein [Cytophaga aurantiaca]|uniref:DUF2147 domain-containing protein n=1 Tax=Cytophaga aurantiaca TaxID=29530 RepID=UPI00036B9ED2|nr:DUF2147 domain-containing protein [Cytophaga aurantiaca]